MEYGHRTMNVHSLFRGGGHISHNPPPKSHFRIFSLPLHIFAGDIPLWAQVRTSDQDEATGGAGLDADRGGDSPAASARSDRRVACVHPIERRLSAARAVWALPGAAGRVGSDDRLSGAAKSARRFPSGFRVFQPKCRLLGVVNSGLKKTGGDSRITT